MKILIVSYFFPPYNCIGAVRVGKTASALERLGHEVRVLSAAEQPLPKTLPLEISEEKVTYCQYKDIDRWITKLAPKEVLTSRVSVAPAKTGRIKSFMVRQAYKIYKSVTAFPDKYIGWLNPALKKGSKILDDFEADLILSSASPYTSHVVARVLATKYKLPWIAELRDLWADNPYLNAGPITRVLERWVLAPADALITVSEPLADILERKYPKKMVATIMNAYDEADFRPTCSAVASSEPIKYRIIYTGALYAGRRDPTPLFSAISSCVELRESVSIEFYGSKSDFLEDLIERFDLRGVVKFGGTLSRSEAIAQQSSADVLLLLTWNDPRENGILTGKLFEYIGARKPILLIGDTGGTAAQLIINNQFGIASNNVLEIRKFLRQPERFAYGVENVRKFERTARVAELEEFLSKVQNL